MRSRCVKPKRLLLQTVAERAIDAAMAKPDEGDRDDRFAWHDYDAGISYVESRILSAFRDFPFGPGSRISLAFHWRAAKILSVR